MLLSRCITCSNIIFLPFWHVFPGSFTGVWRRQRKKVKKGTHDTTQKGKRRADNCGFRSEIHSLLTVNSKVWKCGEMVMTGSWTYSRELESMYADNLRGDQVKPTQVDFFYRSDDRSPCPGRTICCERTLSTKKLPMDDDVAIVNTLLWMLSHPKQIYIYI